MAILRVLGESPTTFELNARFSIGRAATNSLVLADDSQVSRDHAVVAPTSDGYLLTDLGSSNGTRIERDGKSWQVTPEVALQDGDIILVGASRLQFEAGNATRIGMAGAEQTVVGRVTPPRKSDQA
jgi:pSer/pThr/pTyr-binding forkhead associated (FHA) protein